MRRYSHVDFGKPEMLMCVIFLNIFLYLNCHGLALRCLSFDDGEYFAGNFIVSIVTILKNFFNSLFKNVLGDKFIFLEINSIILL